MKVGAMHLGITRKIGIRTLTLTILCVVIIVGISHAARLRSIFHCEYYDHVKDKIQNPRTEDHIYPDTLIWSGGGEEKHGIRLFINCDIPNRIYKSGDLVGIRSGILNCGDEDVYLACAYYSPNQVGSPPMYTLYIDGPENAAKKEKGLLYLGDDVILVGLPKPDLIEIPPGKMFNPSPDCLYYNAWNGILHVSEAGIYKIWCEYVFDVNLADDNAVEKIDSIFSDTIEVIARWNPCSGCLF